MKYNTLGRTGLRVSQLGFGCGAVGGLLVRGHYPAMRRAVARAIELGINYFDTAALYGDGQSEVNLGAVLRELGADVIVGTKARPTGDDMLDVGPAIIRSVESSLRRLGRETIDLIQLHNRLGWRRETDREQVPVSDLEAVCRAFETLRQQGKVRFWGFTGLGETDVLHHALATSTFQSVQIPYNLLNPSAGEAMPPGLTGQDFARIIDAAARRGVGVIAIRILAGGALSGSRERHPVAAPQVSPIASGPSYDADVAAAQRLHFLVKEGIVENLVEAAIRFVIGNPQVSTALVGVSDQEQLEQAVAYAQRGPLPDDVLQRIRRAWAEAGRSAE